MSSDGNDSGLYWNLEPKYGFWNQVCDRNLGTRNLGTGKLGTENPDLGTEYADPDFGIDDPEPELALRYPDYEFGTENPDSNLGTGYPDLILQVRILTLTLTRTQARITKSVQNRFF